MSVLRQAAGGALAGTAKVLGVASKVLETTAKTLRPGRPDAQEAPQRRPAEQVAAERPSALVGDDDVRGRVVEPDPTPLLDETPHVRTSESHIEELAAKPASEVTAAVGGLSTDELRLLTEYEMAHKNRSTVLKAIERALTPAPNGTGGSGGGGAGRTRGTTREIVLPEAGGVPTSGTIDPS